MTPSSITLFAVTGSLLAIKIAIVVMAVVLLAKALLPGQIIVAPLPKAAARRLRRQEFRR